MLPSDFQFAQKTKTSKAVQIKPGMKITGLRDMSMLHMTKENMQLLCQV